MPKPTKKQIYETKQVRRLIDYMKKDVMPYWDKRKYFSIGEFVSDLDHMASLAVCNYYEEGCDI